MKVSTTGGQAGRVRWGLVLLVFAAACVVVPGLFWWGTTFSKRLDDSELLARLAPDASPRAVQHAAEEISRRFEEGRPGMDRWADLLVRSSTRPEAAVRIASAWAMQYDARREAFVARLREMVTDDASPLVRRNAATSLARSGDAAGRAVLVEMLEPHEVVSSGPGRVESLLGADQPVREGDVIARVLREEEAPVEIRAELPGRVISQTVAEGDDVADGAQLLLVAPDPVHALNAAAALAIVGTAEDVPVLTRVAGQRSGFPDDVRNAARTAIEAIRARE